jgi:hypothetical protein
MANAESKSDNVAPENRAIMDYMFEHKRHIPQQHYVKMAELLHDKEKNKKKEYQIKYTMTKAITVAELHFDDEDGPPRVQISTLCQGTKIIKTILRGRKKCTHRKHFHDIVAGDVQLFNGAPSRNMYIQGNTFVDTEYVSSEDDETKGTVTSLLTILEFTEYNSARDVETDGEDL